MEIVNLSANEVLNILNNETLLMDYYRKNIYYGNDNILGLYYKEFLSSKLCDNEYLDTYFNVKEEYISELNKHINIKKDVSEDEYVWEHSALLEKIALINRLEELKSLTKFDKPAITGLALYNGYPVGVLTPRLLTNYKRLSDIDQSKLSLQEKKIIFEKLYMWVEELIKRSVYPIGLYMGNIVFNPNDYSDVVLDGLDGPGIVRVESKIYTRKLKTAGRDLKKESFNNINEIRKACFK